VETSKTKVILGVLATIVLASAANTVVSSAATALGADAAVIQGLTPQAYVFLTAVGVVVAAAAWAVIRRKAARPNALLRKLVPAVVAVSLVPDVLLFGIPGASPIGVIALMLMHVVVASIAVPIFRTVLPLPADGPRADPARA
jgi:acid phosphatase family membrane protein YuiD